MTPEPQPRERIAHIIRDSGAISGAAPSPSPDQLAALAAAIAGASAGSVLASEQIANELAKRFPRLSTNAAVERSFDAPYATVGRALILALQACNHILSAAFDTATGAIIEVKKPMSLLAPAFTVAIAVTDQGSTTHVAAQAQHTGMDWGQNAKLLNQLFDKVAEYLGLFKS